MDEGETGISLAVSRPEEFTPNLELMAAWKASVWSSSQTLPLSASAFFKKLSIVVVVVVVVVIEQENHGRKRKEKEK